MVRGRVHNGVVVLDGPSPWCEGTEVAIEPLPRSNRTGKPAKPPTVGRALTSLAGKARDLPADAARNVDHYLYGHAKR
jgi:hypothetical protein